MFQIFTGIALLGLILIPILILILAFCQNLSEHINVKPKQQIPTQVRTKTNYRTTNKVSESNLRIVK
ncbi:hypothetical protein [Alkaliphilus oremlandii]|uniref:hypothetical protein n=1 Tax=Alkaliphilus oremlandii TaxID=461876 RepID=UPI0002FEA286|nr:hypothetical protein [Alkaliphilus oremlandii]